MQKYNNIVLLSIDDFRADGFNFNRRKYFKGKYSYLIKTPNIDRIAKKGLSLEHTYTTSTYTTSSHASLFTGESPPIHNIRNFFDFNQKLNPKCKTIAEELNNKGYQTFFYSDVPDLFSHMNIWRGFKYKSSTSLINLWASVKKNLGKNNFIFIHLFDVHSPYLYINDQSSLELSNADYYRMIKHIKSKYNLSTKYEPEENPYESFNELRLLLQRKNIPENEIMQFYYQKGIEKFDKYRLPHILDKLKSLKIYKKNSLIIIMGDHGEGRTDFFSGFKYHHSGELTESVIRIPLVFNKKVKIKSRILSIVDLKDFVLSGTNSIKRTKFLNYAEYFFDPVRQLQLLRDKNKKYEQNKNALQSNSPQQNTIILNKLKLIFNDMTLLSRTQSDKTNRGLIELFLTSGLTDRFLFKIGYVFKFIYSNIPVVKIIENLVFIEYTLKNLFQFKKEN